MSNGLQPSTSKAVTPGVNDDISKGYVVGSAWRNTATAPDTLYLCADPAAGAAVWIGPVGSGSGVNPVSSAIVPAPNQVNPATLPGYTIVDNAELVSVTTDANSVMTFTGSNVPSYLPFGGDASPGQERVISTVDDYACVFRISTGATAANADCGATGGLLSSVGLPVCMFLIRNQSGVYDTLILSNLASAAVITGVTAAQANNGIWFRLRIVCRYLVTAEYCLTNTSVEPTAGWINIGVFFMSGAILTQATWIEHFGPYLVAGAESPVSTLSGLRPVNNSSFNK